MSEKIKSYKQELKSLHETSKEAERRAKAEQAKGTEDFSLLIFDYFFLNKSRTLIFFKYPPKSASTCRDKEKTGRYEKAKSRND